MIEIKTESEKSIRDHGEYTYPYECCGLIIGDRSNGKKIVTGLRRMENINTDSPKTRYTIDPLELLKAEKELDDAGLEMLGIYHSHPDHPSRPSQFDLDHAWSNLLYLIISVDKGRAEKLSAWQLDEERREFQELILKVTE